MRRLAAGTSNPSGLGLRSFQTWARDGRQVPAEHPGGGRAREEPLKGDFKGALSPLPWASLEMCVWQSGRCPRGELLIFQNPSLRGWLVVTVVHRLKLQL